MSGVAIRPLAELLPHSFEAVGGYIAKGGGDRTTVLGFGLDLIPDRLDRRRLAPADEC